MLMSLQPVSLKTQLICFNLLRMSLHVHVHTVIMEDVYEEFNVQTNCIWWPVILNCDVFLRMYCSSLRRLECATKIILINDICNSMTIKIASLNTSLNVSVEG